MKKDKLGRNAPLHYPEAFKRQVIEEYLSTGVPKMELVRKYGIRYKSGITKWMRSLGYVEPGRKMTNLVATNNTGLARPNKKQPEPGSAEAEIARLKRELEDERLRSEMYLRMIDIAERDYHIPIRKKPGTK
jgi:transposase-like protein